MHSLSWRTYLAFVITGIFIGLLVTAQVKSSMPTSSFIYDQLAVQKSLIGDYINDQALLKSKIVTLRGKIDEAQAKIRQSSQNNNLETLKGLKSDVGLEAARGKGVEIKLTDGLFVNRENIETIDQSLVAASDLRDIVNLLRTSQAAAIAINDQRVIASTPISSVGNTIMVNNYHLLPPFNITALGDAELIMPRLNDPAALPDLQKRIKDYKIQFSAESKENLSVPVFNGNLNVSFLNQTTNQTP